VVCEEPMPENYPCKEKKALRPPKSPGEKQARRRPRPWKYLSARLERKEEEKEQSSDSQRVGEKKEEIRERPAHHLDQPKERRKEVWPCMNVFTERGEGERLCRGKKGSHTKKKTPSPILTVRRKKKRAPTERGARERKERKKNARKEEKEDAGLAGQYRSLDARFCSRRKEGKKKKKSFPWGFARQKGGRREIKA